MQLEGRRIGPYEISRRIGVGGMGTVYKAHDPRLGRSVAIKVISDGAAASPDFHLRFEREARAAAALTHPHICTLYDVGETAPDAETPAMRFLVMEHIEGETLAHRLMRGAMPQREALECAVQIGSALDCAHRAGLIHRDVKPANIMLTTSGAKLLDFGIARAAADGTTGELTATGLVVGTPYYMAPEQRRGGPVDARSDIWAFGAVLYEMLTGRKALDGALASVAPPALDRAIRRCLVDDPESRWQTMRDLASELQWIEQGGDVATHAAHATHAPRRRWPIAAVGAVALIGAAGLVWSWPREDAATQRRFAITLPDLDVSGAGLNIALVPDGSGLVYRARIGSGSRLQLHTFSDGASRPLDGTADVSRPVFSPDGQWLAFWRGNRLLKTPLAGGGTPILLAQVVAGGLPTAAWGDDDAIVFTTDEGLRRLPASAGASEPLTQLLPDERWHVRPHVLPGARHVLFTALAASGRSTDAQIVAIDVASGQRRTLVTGGFAAQVTRSGHLVYLRDTDLMAAPFDVQRATMTGAPFVVESGVQSNSFSVGEYHLAGDGTLVYVPTQSAQTERTLVWVDATGQQTALPSPPRPYMHPTLMPDESAIVVELEESPHNLYRVDLASSTLTRLTTEGANHRAVLSPDGRQMIYSSDVTTPRSLFLLPTDGSGTPVRLTAGESAQNPTSWSRDGHWVAFTQPDEVTSEDIWILPMQGDRTPRPFLRTPFAEHSAVFSPDGRWIAYSSNESGETQVFVRAFSDGGTRRQISVEGGDMPLFSYDGTTLYYQGPDAIMAVSFSGTSTLSTGPPRAAFTAPPTRQSGQLNYSLKRDGSAALVIQDPDRAVGPRSLQVVLNWFSAIEAAARTVR